MVKSDLLLEVKSAMMESSYQSEKRRLTTMKDKISCTPGCSSCCSRMIHITVAEALVMWTYLSNDNKLKEVLKRAEELISISRITNHTSWFKMKLVCPILDPKTKLCLSYAVRPSACSIHFVSSDPSICDPWNTEIGIYKSESMTDLYQNFRKILENEVSGHGIFAFMLPMPQAIVLADRVSRIKWSDWSQMADFVLQELT